MNDHLVLWLLSHAFLRGCNPWAVTEKSQRLEQYANETIEEGYWKNAGTLGVSQILLYLFLFVIQKNPWIYIYIF